jgi:hypothetical protein
MSSKTEFVPISIDAVYNIYRIKEKLLWLEKA